MNADFFFFAVFVTIASNLPDRCEFSDVCEQFPLISLVRYRTGNEFLWPALNNLVVYCSESACLSLCLC